MSDFLTTDTLYTEARKTADYRRREPLIRTPEPPPLAGILRLGGICLIAGLIVAGIGTAARIGHHPHQHIEQAQ